MVCVMKINLNNPSITNYANKRKKQISEDESNKEVVEKTSDKDINENDSTNKNEISNNFSLIPNFEDNYIWDD